MATTDQREMGMDESQSGAEGAPGTVGEALASLVGNVIDNALDLAEQATTDGLRVARAARGLMRDLSRELEAAD